MSENENVRHGEPPVCKHYQRGYCRYGSKCLQPHISKICKDRICRKHNCRERHPRTCKFYASNGECKWKDTCAYEHRKSGDEIKIDILEKEVKYFKEELQNLNNNMSEMMVKMLYLEGKKIILSVQTRDISQKKLKKMQPRKVLSNVMNVILVTVHTLR